MFKKNFIGIIGILVVVALAGIWFYSSRALKKSSPPIPVGANRALAEHSKIFKKGVEKVGGNIFAAIGYGIANSIMIEGDDGVIIVDTMTTMEEAAEVLAEFRKITPKPVKAIIYTHSHPDHVFGAEAFVAAAGRPEIYAHETPKTMSEGSLPRSGRSSDHGPCGCTAIFSLPARCSTWVSVPWWG
jgi:glyoxylase-like metal-dependent hydrolase (beta-lactamase superfamily II)